MRRRPAQLSSRKLASMSQGFSAPLGICLAAAGVAVGALFIEVEAPGDRQVSAQDVTHHPTQPDGYADSSAPAAPTETSASVAELSIDSFSLESVTVSPGATVTVINNDSAPHTATANDRSFDTGTIAPGGSATFVAPTQPGTYQLYCAIHPSMTATITVG